MPRSRSPLDCERWAAWPCFSARAATGGATGRSISPRGLDVNAGAPGLCRSRCAHEATVPLRGSAGYDETPPQVAGDAAARGLREQDEARATASIRRRDGPHAALPRDPARVAAGFTSGTCTTPHAAPGRSTTGTPTWVEVWFPGYGWLFPFDPTPGEGNLSGPYTSSSISLRCLGRGEGAERHRFDALGRSLLRSEFSSPRKARTRRPRADSPRPRKATRGGSSGNGRRTARCSSCSVLGLALLFVGKLVRAAGAIRRAIRVASRRAAAVNVVGIPARPGCRDSRATRLADLGRLAASDGCRIRPNFVDALGLARFGPASIGSDCPRSAECERYGASPRACRRPTVRGSVLTALAAHSA